MLNDISEGNPFLHINNTRIIQNHSNFYLNQKSLKISFFLIAGRIEPIAGQLIDLGKRSSSTDNISVIVIFLKDPNLIVSEYNNRKTKHDLIHYKMDFENTNGHSGLVGDSSTTTPSSEHLNALDDYQTHVQQSIDLKGDHHNSQFIFGNPTGNFMSNETANVQIKSNGDGHHSNFDDSEPEDDGPETDVDATDDGRFQSERFDSQFNKQDDFDQFVEKTESIIDDVVAQVQQHQQNPFAVVDDDDELIKKNENENSNPFVDNHYVDNVKAAADEFKIDNLAQSKIDFSEKKEYSFEREDYEKEREDYEKEREDNEKERGERKEYSFEREDFEKEHDNYEKELDPLGDIPAELIAITKEVAIHDNDNHDRDDDDDDDEDRVENGDLDHESHIVTTEVVTTEQHGNFFFFFYL